MQEQEQEQITIRGDNLIRDLVFVPRKTVHGRSSDNEYHSERYTLHWTETGKFVFIHEMRNERINAEVFNSLDDFRSHFITEISGEPSRIERKFLSRCGVNTQRMSYIVRTHTSESETSLIFTGQMLYDDGCKLYQTTEGEYILSYGHLSTAPKVFENREELETHFDWPEKPIGRTEKDILTAAGSEMTVEV